MSLFPAQLPIESDPQCLGQPLALALAQTFIVLFSHYLDDLPTGLNIHLDESFQPDGTRIPAEWKDERGDGRCRSGRDKVWIVSVVVLAVKVGRLVRLAKNVADGRVVFGSLSIELDAVFGS
jgi:hypothetical protein